MERAVGRDAEVAGLESLHPFRIRDQVEDKFILVDPEKDKKQIKIEEYGAEYGHYLR